MFDKVIRELIPNTIILYKRYNKYILYNKDAKIVTYICKYKYYFKNKIIIDDNYLNYILKYLNINNINYMIIDLINQNDLIDNKEYIDNKYNMFNIKSKRYFKRIERIKKINNIINTYDNNKLININNILDSYIC